MTGQDRPERTSPLKAKLTLDQLATALAKAQAAFPAVPKSGKNPFLKNEYATLDDIIGAVRKPLGDNGLSFVQLLGSNGALTLRTILLHESGQMLESTVTIDASGPEKGINALQSIGKSITYMKRYMLGAMLGVATDGDTDGEDGSKQQPAQRQRTPKPEPTNRPLDGPAVRDAIRAKAKWVDGARVDGEPITEGQVKSVGSLLGEAVMFHGMTQAIADKARHDVLDYLVGVDGTRKLSKLEASAIISWLKEKEDGNWDLNQYAKAEAQAVLKALSIEAGQQEMEL